jgi:hypothetical protein
VLPKIFYTNTSYEYWSRAASLIHTSPDGTRDLPLLDNVRVYLYAGLQHFSGPFPPARSTNAALPGIHPQSPLPVAWLWRAMLVNMDEWARDNTLPPPSSYPRLADGTLVPRERLAFPAISGVTLPQNVHRAYRTDYGALWSKGIITKEPPTVGAPFPSFVPQTDADGNERAGIRLPELTVPLATYTGWNLRTREARMAGDRVSFLGSYFPFAKRKADRTRTDDKRLSIEERYTSREQYLKLYNAAAQKLVGQRFLLREDLANVVSRGGQEWDEAMK